MDIKTHHFDKKGRRWVNYRYLWDGPQTTRLGVLAQEIIETDASAVLPGPFYMVDYSKLMDA